MPKITESIWDYVDSKYQPGYTPPEELRVLISGMPRSGTTYMRTLLDKYTRAGHESIFGLGKVYEKPRGCSPIVEVSGFSAPWALACKMNGVRIVRLMRDPVKCCASCVNYFSAGEWNIDWHSTCRQYLKYHKLLDGLAEFTLYLETLSQGAMPALFSAIGLPLPRNLDSVMASTSHGGSSWPHPPRRWGDLPEALQKYAERHGYGPK